MSCVNKNYEISLQKVKNWLNSSVSGCVYFTAGSMVKIESFPREKLDALYEAFRRISPIRILMKIANEKELPPGLPENVMIDSWFSQLQVWSMFTILEKYAK